MEAAVWYGKGDVRVEEVPTPEINDFECLVAVKYCGLCKTDVKKIRGHTLSTKGSLDPPRVFGHEIVGEIRQVGKYVEGWREGDRVAIYHHVPCNNCYYCDNLQFSHCETYKTVDTSSSVGKPSGGGFAEFVKIPKLVVEKGMVKIPDKVDYETAVFMEPTNCCLKGIDKAEISIGDTVAVIGQGPIGLTLDQLATLSGARVIGVDLTDYRLKKAVSSFGASYVVNAAKEDSVKKIKEIANGRGVDTTIVAVEEPAAVIQALKYARPGGAIVFFAEFGSEHSLTEEEKCLGQKIVDGIYGKELNVIGSYSSSYLRHLDAAELVFTGRINTKDQISHITGLDKLEEMVETAVKRRANPWSDIVENVDTEYSDPLPEERSFKILIKP